MPDIRSPLSALQVLVATVKGVPDEWKDMSPLADPPYVCLRVPTGGGKTLSSLMFALHHARANQLERIIYVAPYLTVIEQNARVFRDALGPGAEDLILEHHSLAEPKAAVISWR